MTQGQEFYIELLTRKLQEGNGRSMHERLTELLETARRGIELRSKFSPKTGRRFLLHPNTTR
jgi:hypothetical protein